MRRVHRFIKVYDDYEKRRWMYIYLFRATQVLVFFLFYYRRRYIPMMFRNANQSYIHAFVLRFPPRRLVFAVDHNYIYIIIVEDLGLPLHANSRIGIRFCKIMKFTVLHRAMQNANIRRHRAFYFREHERPIGLSILREKLAHLLPHHTLFTRKYEFIFIFSSEPISAVLSLAFQSNSDP